MTQPLWKAVSYEEETEHLQNILDDVGNYIEPIDDYEWEKINPFFSKFIVSEGDPKIILTNSPYSGDSERKILGYSDRMIFYDSSNTLEYNYNDEYNDEIEPEEQYFMEIIIMKDSEDWFWISCVEFLFIAPDYYDDIHHYFHKCDQLRGIMDFLNSEFHDSIGKNLIQKK